MERTVLEDFVDSWGKMGSIWGIRNPVARVQALLIASDDPISLSEIAETLKISKNYTIWEIPYEKGPRETS